ncbi:restriction endonuclease subunit S [Butyrivibrio proteoclasticus]|uniref:restriction endonuclease subunit S n=1 Tax=Butyrivibrio proteoclasticus TaxID=43305 RepID=UPI000686B689|nr:restriction endonuclease subunit S [Butyrivibrio proteoclasticus]
MEYKKLSEVCDVRDGTHDSPKYVTEGYPLVTSKNIVDGKLDLSVINYLSQEDYDKINERSKVDVGDIIMPMIGTIGNPYIVENFTDFAIKNVALVKFPYDSINNRYVWYYLKSESFNRYVAEKNKGGTQKFLSLGDIRSLNIPVINKNEQAEIVELLDKVSSIIELRKDELIKMDELIKARFVEMFGDPVLNPFGWEEKTVIDECDCMVPGRDKPKSFTGNIPWITIEDLNVNSITYNSKSGLGLTQEEIDSVNRKAIPEGSVIMSCVGNLGICSIAGRDMIINQQLHSFQCGQNVNNVFLMYYLGYRKDYMNKWASNTTVLYMNKTICNSIPIIIPPTGLQLEFSEFVKQVDKSKVVVQKSLDEVRKLFDSLMQEYFG